MGVGLRTAQRDLKTAPSVIAKFETIKNRLDNPEPVDKTYSVLEAADILNLNPDHVRLLARRIITRPAHRGAWRFTEANIELLKHRCTKTGRKPSAK